MVGVFAYEGSRSASTVGSLSFGVTWSTSDSPGPSGKGTTDLGQKTEAKVNVPQANLTRLAFTVTWSATNGKDTVKITVVPPAGSGLVNKSIGPVSSGKADVVFDVPNKVPASTTVFADSESKARERLAASHTSSLGAGEWHVVVEFTEASGVDPLPLGPPVQQDTTLNWDVKSVESFYEPKLVMK